MPDQHVDTFFGNEENEGSKRDTDETSGSSNPKTLASKGGETVPKRRQSKRDNDDNPVLENPREGTISSKSSPRADDETGMQNSVKSPVR